MSSYAIPHCRRSPARLAALAAVGMLVLAANVSAATFFDGDFLTEDWTRTVIGTGTSTSTRVTTGGNPGAFLSITNITDIGQTVRGVYLNGSAIYTPSLEGAIESIDYSEEAKFIAGGGNHQAGGIAIRQDGIIYIRVGNAFTNSADWGPLLTSVVSTPMLPVSFAGLKEGDFIGASNAALHPDFGLTGSAITFGFFRANAGANTRISGIDNWSVTLNKAAAPVPLPAAVWGQLAALALLWRRRRAA